MQRRLSDRNARDETRQARDLDVDAHHAGVGAGGRAQGRRDGDARSLRGEEDVRIGPDRRLARARQPVPGALARIVRVGIVAPSPELGLHRVALHELDDALAVGDADELRAKALLVALHVDEAAVATTHVRARDVRAGTQLGKKVALERRVGIGVEDAVADELTADSDRGLGGQQITARLVGNRVGEMLHRRARVVPEQLVGVALHAHQHDDERHHLHDQQDDDEQRTDGLRCHARIWRRAGFERVWRMAPSRRG